MCNGAFSNRPVHQADNNKGVIVADNDFKQHTDMQIATKRQQDFDDLQNEQAGRDTGRMQRFGVSQSQQAEIQRKKDEKFRDHLTALERLLRDNPAYAALHQQVMKLLNEAEHAAQRALDQAREDLCLANESLEDIQDRANQLPDGTRIYKDADGNVWTEDGRLVSQEELEGVVWKDGAPSWENYLNGKQAADDARSRIKDIEDYVYNVLGPSRDKMTDPNNPPSKDDMEDIDRKIRDKAPKAVAEIITPDADISAYDLAPSISGALPKI